MHILFAIARVLLVAIFVVSGATKLLDIHGTAAVIQPLVTIPDMLQDIVAQAENLTGMKWPQLLAIFAGVVEVVGGLLIAFNIATRVFRRRAGDLHAGHDLLFPRLLEHERRGHAEQHGPRPEESLHHRRASDLRGAGILAADAVQPDVEDEGRGVSARKRAALRPPLSLIRHAGGTLTAAPIPRAACANPSSQYTRFAPKRHPRKGSSRRPGHELHSFLLIQ